MTDPDRITINAPRSTPKGRFTVTTKSEGLTFDLNPERIGSPIAAAIAEAIRESIASLPGKLFNRTGRLIDGIAARLADDSTWTIAAPADRLQRDPKLLERLVDAVPMLKNPAALLDHPKVKAAREIVAATLVTKRKTNP